ncbi:MAG: hypothetical protein ACFFDT_07340 [Candidatus Hodarchaeota archaeon]
MNNLITLILILFSLIILVKVFAFFWKILDDSSLYDVASERIKINTKVSCITSVDEKGGLVHINVGPPEESIKHSAINYTGIIFEKGSLAYVIGKEGSDLIIDIEPLPHM